MSVMTWNSFKEGIFEIYMVQKVIFEHLGGSEKAFFSISPCQEPRWILGIQSCTSGILFVCTATITPGKALPSQDNKEKKHLAKSSQQTALLAAEFVGVSVKPGPATEQWAKRPQYEESDKGRWGPLLSRALCLSRGPGLAPHCMFPLYKAFSLSCKLQQPWLSCRASGMGFL